MSQKVAILIPTKNRIDFVIRTIQYYASINSPHPIFIGDASADSLEKYILEIVKNEIEVYYFHWKGLNDRKTIQKLAIEAKRKNIRYCAYHGDDDYFFPESLSKCANFLNSSPSYATAQGQAFSFQLDCSGPYGNIKDVGIYWNRKELIGRTATERLIEISNSYWVPLFSVNRIDNYIQDIGNGIDTVVDRNFGEYINSISIALRGRSKFIDCLYLARNIHDGINHGTKFEWVVGENWHTSYVGLINSLSQTLLNYDGVEPMQSKKSVVQAIRNLLALEGAKKISLYVFIRSILINWSNNNKFWHILKSIYKRLSLIVLFSCTRFSKRCLVSSKSKYFEHYLTVQQSCKKTVQR